MGAQIQAKGWPDRVTAGADSKYRRQIHRFPTAPSQALEVCGSARQEGCVPSHSFLDVHQVSDFKAFLPGLGTVLVSISKTALNLNTQKQQEVGFFPHTEVFGHMFDVRLFCLQNYSPGRKGK